MNENTFKRILWVIHWVLFGLAMGAGITVDFSGSIYWLPVRVSGILSVGLYSVGPVVGAMVLFHEKRGKRKMAAGLALVLYVLMLLPVFAWW